MSFELNKSNNHVVELSAGAEITRAVEIEASAIRIAVRIIEIAMMRYFEGYLRRVIVCMPSRVRVEKM
jgi:hypothetical protein